MPKIDFKNRKWVIYGASGWPAYLDPFAIVPSRYFLRDYGISVETVVLLHGQIFDWLYDEASLIKVAQKVLPIVKRKKWKVYQDWKKCANEFNNLYHQLIKADLSNLTHDHLIEKAENYFEKFMEQLAASNFIEAISYYFQLNLKNILIKEDISSERAELLISRFGISAKPNYIKKFVSEFKIASDSKSRYELLKEYQYMNTDVTGSKPFTITDAFKLVRRENHTHTSAVSGHISKANRSLLHVLQITATIQDTRKAETLMWVQGAECLLKEIAKRKRLPVSLLRMATWTEILGDSSKVSELRKRERYCVVDWKVNKTFIHSGNSAHTLIESFRKTLLKKSGNSNELKGITASNGRVSGRAVVVLNPSQFGKVRRGDILVTSMTRPEYLSIMEKAAAFVTDEGGITSHAAIVAREMKKPCIIATRIGSKVLKDGDMVEVDANRGIVKILKRA